MDTILLWGKVGIGAVVLLLVFLWVVLPLIRKFWPALIPAGASPAIDLGTAWADMGAFITSALIPMGIAKRRGETVALEHLRAALADCLTWDDTPPATTVTITPAIPVGYKLVPDVTATTIGGDVT